jgi:hypothetical protein
MPHQWLDALQQHRILDIGSALTLLARLGPNRKLPYNHQGREMDEWLIISLFTAICGLWLYNFESAGRPFESGRTTI